MAEKSIFEQIKKQNGEHFAKAIRGYDNGIFDIPDIVDIVKYAGPEAEPIMEYLESLKEIHIEESGVYQDPITLLDIAGYRAYYVTNLEEQNAIKKYYAKGEGLCTFRDPHRFEKYHIINAVRKDVDQIKREDFIGKERREDRYGTSVISIQILKTGGFISIKNRYNHTVQSPDNTLNSNPDNIIPGLSNSLRHHFKTDFSAQRVQLPNGYAFIGGKIIQYNYEENNTYFGPNFYVKDNQIYHLESHEMMLDTYIFDLRKKTLFFPASSGGISFEDIALKSAFLKEIEGHKVIVKKDKEGQHLFIHKEGEKGPDTEILGVKDGIITSVNFPTITKLDGSFLVPNRHIKSFTAPNLLSVGTHFLASAAKLEKIEVPRLKSAESNFLEGAKSLTSFSAPDLKYVDDYFLYSAYHLRQINIPNLETAGAYFISNSELETLDVPELTTLGYSSLSNCPELLRLNAPKLSYAAHGFLSYSEKLKELFLPELTLLGNNALEYGRDLVSFHAPKLTKIGDHFLRENKSLKSLDLPLLKEIGTSTLCFNTVLETLNIPLLKKIEPYFLERNICLRTLNAPSLVSIERGCLTSNTALSSLRAPMLKDVSDDFIKAHPHRDNLLKNGHSGVTEEKVSVSETPQTATIEEGPKGISAQLKPTANPQTPINQPPQDTSFFTRIRDWLSPQK